MKVVFFTSNLIRHKFVANTIAKAVDDILIVSECKKNDAANIEKLNNEKSPMEEHFYLRYINEQNFFAGNDFFIGKTIPLLNKEANLDYTYNVVKSFKPDLMLAFGPSLIKSPLLYLLEPGRFVNLHLGISPYYRGSATNFWPFVNQELEYVGATFLHIDEGVDTGDIISHVRPKIEIGDNVHTVGCKVIKESAEYFVKIIKMIADGKPLKRVKQWKADIERVCLSKDFCEESLMIYKNNLANGLIENYLSGSIKNVSLVLLE